MIGVACVNGQLERLIEMPCQRRRDATRNSAERQWVAWLSPTSATTSVASSAGEPNVQR
jgi:hypothetical protein